MVLPMALNHSLNGLEKVYVLFGSFILAAAMYFIVEQPIRSRALLSRRPTLSLSMGGVFVAASVTVALVVATGAGLPVGSSSGTVQAAAATPSAIDTALASAVNLKALAANVTPSLSKAGVDRPAATNKCLLGNTATQPLPNSACTFGDVNGTKTMVLVGDSHANAWEPALAAFASANGFKLVQYAMAGCPPGLYPNDVDPNTNRLYTTCNEFRTAVYSRLKALKPNYVVVTSELRTLDIDPSGMVTSIRNYQTAGARVIYLEDTPNPQKVGSVPDCLAKHTNNIQACAMARTDPSTRLEAMIQRRTEAQAAQQAGATLVDPTSWFCTATSCPPVIDNMIVYADNSHITATYAAWLAPLMSTALKKITG